MAARDIRTTCRTFDAGVPHPDTSACALLSHPFLTWSTPETWRVLRHES